MDLPLALPERVAAKLREEAERAGMLVEELVAARYSIPEYSLSFSLTFRLEKITFGLLNIEFINPASISRQ